jgi:alpha-amylase/alpha-mannosidase (GH57 family)
MSDIYSSRGETIYLVLIFHQHQPFYVDQEKDFLRAPWVRTHATKDYYRLPHMLKKFPNVHISVNLTPSLLVQLKNYYLDRIKPFVDIHSSKFNVKSFVRKSGYRTDALFDLLLKPAAQYTVDDLKTLYKNEWSALSINEVVRKRFPELNVLFEEFASTRRKSIFIKAQQKVRELKFWFSLANIDLEILDGPVKLDDESICDLSDLVEKRSDYKYYLRHKITEQDCQRLAVEIYKIISNIIPIHKRMRYRVADFTGQVELTTTPFSHPILPLLCNSNIGKICMPYKPFPKEFKYPEDADEQIRHAVLLHKNFFGDKPLGLWPSEGSISQGVIPIIADHGIQWIATDVQVLNNSLKSNPGHLTPYKLKSGDSELAVFFRDTELSDRVGFRYQHFQGEEAADDFIKYVLSCAPKDKRGDRLINVIMDGENAWEWYHHDYEAREFFSSLYRKLEKLYASRQIVTVTPAEYIYGNPRRQILPHPISQLPHLEYITPGSWIHGDFSRWIGTQEKNQLWEFLLKAREDLEKIKLPKTNQKTKKDTKAWYTQRAWEEIYYAEGSDWFWWGGEDQESSTNQKPFDELFYQHLRLAYEYAIKAGYEVEIPDFPTAKIIPIKSPKVALRSGTMHQGHRTVKVKFICDARKIDVKKAIYIVGNLDELAEWIPNKVALYDDGTHGDLHAKDGLWTLELNLPEGLEIHYKYTNSGRLGEWGSSEEFPALNRSVIVTAAGETFNIKDTYGKL